MHTPLLSQPLHWCFSLLRPMHIVSATAASSQRIACSNFISHPDYAKAEAQAQALLENLAKAHQALAQRKPEVARQVLAFAAAQDAGLCGMMPAETATGSADAALLPLCVNSSDEALAVSGAGKTVRSADRQTHVVTSHVVYLSVSDVGTHIAAARDALMAQQPDLKVANDEVERALGSLLVTETQFVQVRRD